MKLIEGLTFELPIVENTYIEPRDIFKRQSELIMKEICYFLYHKAIEKGFLEKPDSCDCCKQMKKSIDGHHDDYSYPLKVRWLCKNCHYALHQEIRKMHKDKALKDYLSFAEKRMNGNDVYEDNI